MARGDERERGAAAPRYILGCADPNVFPERANAVGRD